VGPGSFTPGSQLQQAFFSVFPQRSQRAINEASIDVHKTQYPKLEFGGFIPLSN